MTSKDPLQLLREYTIAEKEIKLKDDNLQLGGKLFPLSTQTNWRPKGSDRSYKLGEIWLFLKNKVGPQAKSGNQYFVELGTFGKTHSLKLVTVSHQDEMVKYFTGAINTSEDLNTSDFMSMPHKQQGGDLGKRTKMSNGLIEDKNGGMKLIKTELNDCPTVAKMLEGIDFSDRNKGDAAYEEAKKNLQAVRLKERILESKNTRMRKNRSFKFCIELLESSSARVHEQKEKTHQTVLQEIMGQTQLEEARPIILVPDAPLQGNLCLRNAKSFLLDGRYMEITSTKQLDSNTIEFKHPINDQDITFEVTDDIASLRASRKINRVVAIFLTNNPYQFKNAERNFGEGNIAKLLKKMRGYVMKYSDVPLNDTVKTWNTKILSINRTQRHKDILIKREFWEDMSKFLNTTR